MEPIFGGTKFCGFHSVLPPDSGGIITFGAETRYGGKEFFSKQGGDNFGGGKPNSQDRYEGEQNISVKGPFNAQKHSV